MSLSSAVSETKSSIAYLGSPYSDVCPKIRRFRERAVTQMAYDLMKQGTLVYSPLTHNIPIDRLGFFGYYLTWKSFDHGMLSRCDQLLVFKLPGWEQSKGLAAEIQCAKSLGLPIEEIEPTQAFINKIQGLEDDQGSLNEILKQLNTLIAERDWAQFHSPKNLAMNLHVEAGELAEYFCWLTEEQSKHLIPELKQRVSEELADVFINVVHLCQTFNIDLFSVTLQKLKKISEKYPSTQAQGLKTFEMKFNLSPGSIT